MSGTVKKLLKLDSICQSYAEMKTGPVFFWVTVYIAPWRRKTEMSSENKELNQARWKPDPVNPPLRTVHTTVQSYNGTQNCSTETVLLIYFFLRTKIAASMWPRGGKGANQTRLIHLQVKPNSFFHTTSLSEQISSNCDQSLHHWCLNYTYMSSVSHLSSTLRMFLL